MNARLRSTHAAGRALAALVVSGAAACAPPSSDGGPTVRAIYGGTADLEHDAVMALIHVSGAGEAECSGTTIAQFGTSAVLLTAAHCVVQLDATGNVALPVTVLAPSALTVVPGPDWQTSVALGHTFQAVERAVAPGYDGAVESPNDIALVRFVTSMPSLPTIPILEAADDALATGTVLTLVGYGRTETNAQNSVRREVDRPIQKLDAHDIVFDESGLEGSCHGDSGGPALLAGTRARVAGVISYGDTACSMFDASVRVSSLAPFVDAFLKGLAPADAGSPADSGAPRDAAASEGGVGADGGPFADAAPPPACGKLTDPRPACAACIAGPCCREAAICAADPLCLGCGANPMASCLAYPPSATLTACLNACAGAPCGGARPPDAAAIDGAAAEASAPPDAPAERDAEDASRDDAPRADAPESADVGPVDVAGAPDAGPDAVASHDARSLDADASGGPRSSLTRSGCGCEVSGAPGVTGREALLLLLVVNVRRRGRLVRRRRSPLS